MKRRKYGASKPHVVKRLGQWYVVKGAYYGKAKDMKLAYYRFIVTPVNNSMVSHFLCGGF